MANFGILDPNQQRAHYKLGTTRPSKAIHTAIYAEGVCPYTHRANHNRHMPTVETAPMVASVAVAAASCLPLTAVASCLPSAAVPDAMEPMSLC